MKKTILFLLIVVILTGTGCGTILGGKISACQKTKPADGQPKRKIRTFALIGDISAGGVFTIVDFIDGGIYKPCKK